MWPSLLVPGKIGKQYHDAILPAPHYHYAPSKGQLMDITAEDPVCNRKFALEKAVAAEEYKGWTYFFCSTECQTIFIGSPTAFANGPAPLYPYP